MATRRTRLLVVAAMLGCLAFATPVSVTMYMAWQRGHEDADASLDLLASHILRRAAMLRFQSNAAIDRLVAGGVQEACTVDDLDQMRRAAASSGYMQGIGRMRGNWLQCSSLTGNTPTDLGAPDRSYPLPGSPLAWDRVRLPRIDHTRFAVTARAGYAVLSLPELVSDIPLPPGAVVGQFATGDRKVMRASGDIDSEWLQHFSGKNTSFEDSQGRWVAIKLSDLGYTAAVAAMPASLVMTYVYNAAIGLLPVGLAIGSALLAIVLWRTHYLLSIGARLKRALRRREFHLVYQPVMNLRTNRCEGAEALIRWSPPDEQGMSPTAFIPAAERHGLIQQVTAQVMDIVARDAVTLIMAFPDIHIAINFSAEDLHSVETEARLLALLNLAGAQSHNIMIEATERGLMKPEKAKDFLMSIRARGFKVAIDDFGTGHSSLSYLATYELDVLKIDKMFVDSFEQESPTTKVAFHIIEMARALGLEMIAEGVETEHQRDVLRDAGVHYAQGWLFAKPMPIAELAAFIRSTNDS
ncbi:EAL domain-containing protein [Pseudomonas matsuisoli]|uniref:cyclic-guanylate-specific phosphodiesterase n=1 Tax=Pseudomonas matsuisoli TaxID=1515666 RepID=A0A917UV52_9PSED|nr:EAL domain-containing protein [Pseudomonas matsuisoli]GGJ88634.1 cyclic diguanylate phosphodiesterase [Pseudomonas matsuisoli]